MEQCMENVKIHIEKIIKHLEKYTGLCNDHMVEFFTKNLYENSIPSGIRNEIEFVGYENTIDAILNDAGNENQVNLTKFIQISKELTLYNITSICIGLEQLKETLNLETVDGNMKFGNQLKTMKHKKAHEVNILSNIAVGLYNNTGCSHLVDLGDGKGYLGRFLAENYDIPVLGVDVTTAIHKKPLRTKLYKQIARLINDNDNLNDVLKDEFTMNQTSVGLIGLHTCGNLSPLSLNIFVRNSDIKAICNVGCCYHLLNEGYLPNSMQVEQKTSSYPLSKYLINRNFVLERTGRMLAAQSIDRIKSTKNLPSKIIFYRSIFELLLQTHYNIPSDEKRTIGRFKEQHADVTFSDYVRECCRRLDLTPICDDATICDFYAQHSEKQTLLNIYHLLRSFLAPVIESLILLDRYLFLLEQGLEHVYLVKLFDPVVSPRCYGLIAFK